MARANSGDGGNRTHETFLPSLTASGTETPDLIPLEAVFFNRKERP
jgi:hypothetical protein